MASFKRLMLDGSLRGLTTGMSLVFGEERRAGILAHVVERLAPAVTIETPSGSLMLHCPGELPIYRARTLLTKEPETIEWIDAFQPGDVLWDIGANVGVYSLYAGLKPDVQVLAFEPAAVNCYVLNRNIELNGLDGNVAAFCLAFSESTKLDYLYMRGTRIGGASHTFREEVDSKGKPVQARFRQGAVGFAIDDLMATFHPAFPNHLKIDVDGIEEDILRGAVRTIADGRLKSVMVELDIDRAEGCRRVEELLGHAGLRLLRRARAAMFDGTPYASIYNHVFVRV